MLQIIRSFNSNRAQGWDGVSNNIQKLFETLCISGGMEVCEC